MQIRQTQKLTQKIILTPQMRQSIHILQLPILDLKDYIENQIEENPVLERKSPEKPIEEHVPQEKIKALLELSEKSQENITSYSFEYSSDDLQKKQHYKESLITKELNLHEYLLGQLRLNRLSKNEHLIGEFIIGNIDNNGYLKLFPEDILRILKKNKFLKGGVATKKDIEKIINLIKTLEPLGLCARNLKDCLFIQLRAKHLERSLAYKIVNNHLVDLARNRYSVIAKKLKKTLSEVKKAAKQISYLEPKPGRKFSQERNLRRRTILPDIIIEKNEDRYELIMNTQSIPQIKINTQYKNLLKSDEIPDDAKQYLSQKVSAALTLIKSISQREQTIKKIAALILKVQKNFIETGDLAQLAPLTIRQVAKKIGRNESTVSRVVNNKYIQAPYGIFKLNSFFSTHLTTHQGEKISTENIKSLIHEMVSSENLKTPLRDNKIVTLLEKQGIKIARRTIAKYREALKIPPHHQRKVSKK